MAVEYDEVYPHATNGSLTDGITLGIIHKFNVRPDEVVRLHQVTYHVANFLTGAANHHFAWALSFDASHQSLTTDLNFLITDIAAVNNLKIWLRATASQNLVTSGGRSHASPIVVPMHGYTIGRSVICLYFNETDNAVYPRTGFWWEPVRVGVSAANTMHMRRSVIE